MRLQTKLILLLIPCVLAPLAVLGWLVYGQWQAAAEQDTKQAVSTLLDQVESRLKAELATAASNLELFSGSTFFQRYARTEDEEKRYGLMQGHLLELFASYQRAYPQYLEIRYLLPDGFEDTRVARHGLQNRTEEEAGDGFFQELSRSQARVHHSVRPSPDTGEYTMYIGRRVMLHNLSDDPAHTKPILRGYLVLSLDLEFLGEQAREARVGQTGHLWFQHTDGAVLFDPNPEVIHGIPDAATDDRIRTKTGTPRFSRLEHAGAPALVMSRLVHPDLVALAVLPEWEFRALTAQVRRSVAAVMLVAMVLTSLLLLGILRLLVLRPVRQLRDATHRLAEGSLDVTIELDQRDELGELARAFETMALSLQQSGERERFLAYRDPLTGLANRTMFMEKAERAVRHARRDELKVAVLYMDLDNFKQVNDTLGHHAGDELLDLLGKRLLGGLRSTVRAHQAREDIGQDCVGRLGGDEFAILLHDPPNLEVASKIADRLLKAILKPVMLGEHEFHVGVSIGIALFPDDAGDLETLLKHADLAMYHAKRQGRRNYQHFQHSMNAEALTRLSLENDLRRALERNELVLHYQPQICARSGALAGFEALLRWQHPERGLLGPIEFIDLAEETGLINPVSEWVVEEACRQMKTWQDNGAGDLSMAVNISNSQLRWGGLVNMIRSAVKNSGLAAGFLEVELTETAVMEAGNATGQTLAALKSLGVRIAMDDFGTVYSSLGALRHMPIDNLKVDRSFVQDIEAGDEAMPLISAITGMARSLGIRVTAEGVEYDYQLDLLRRLGCDLIQGYLVARPAPPEEITERLKMSTYAWPTPLLEHTPA